jgi:hypothetical protein
MNGQRSDARKTTRLAISSGVPNRFKHCPSARFRVNCSIVRPRDLASCITGAVSMMTSNYAKQTTKSICLSSTKQVNNIRMCARNEPMQPGDTELQRILYVPKSNARFRVI